jgi:RNA polymerase sigma-70 factor (ECF subfamily)
MMMTQIEIDVFNASLKDVLPRLRVYAMSLTRDRDRADNLVQQTSLKALAGRESFRPGTNFSGWIFRIERNEFISELRRGRPTVDIDAAGATPSTPPRQDSGLVMREFMTAFRQLSRGSRQALLLSRLEGHTHEQIASRAGVAVGTVKSRMWRGRAALQRLLAGKAVGDDGRRSGGTGLNAQLPAPQTFREQPGSALPFEHHAKAPGHIGSGASRSPATGHQGAES